MKTHLRAESGKMWAIVWPLIITNLLNVSVGIIDFKMVGSLGVESIAAVGIARQVMMFLMVLMVAISGGASVIIANAYGARDTARVSGTAAQSILFMVVAGLLIVTPAGLVSSRGFLILLGGSGQVVTLGTRYLLILFAGSIFTMLNFAVNGVLLGVGKTRVSLAILLGVNLLNIGLNYLFIFGPGRFPALGVAGAAVGTVSARALGSIAGILVVKTEPVMAFAFAMSGALRGAGDPNSPFLAASVSDLVVVILAGYLFAIVGGMGFAGIALGLALSAVTRALPVTIVFKRGRWRSIRV